LIFLYGTKAISSNIERLVIQMKNLESTSYNAEDLEGTSQNGKRKLKR
jgi:hypothetical protein